MSQFFGRATVTINGQTFNSKPGASFDPGGVTRSTETTDQRSGYTEALRPAVVKLEIPLESGISVPSMNDMDNVTVQFWPIPARPMCCPMRGGSRRWR